VVILVARGTLPIAARRRVLAAALVVMAVASAVLTGLGRSPLALDVTVGLGAYTVRRSLAGLPRGLAPRTVSVTEKGLRIELTAGTSSISHASTAGQRACHATRASS
jgi:hypothetical protein